MIIDKNKTYTVNKIGQNLVLLDNELYYLDEINNINFLICLNNTNIIIANATTGIGFSFHNGVMIGVKFASPVEEWIEIERCRFDGNTFVDIEYLIEQGGIIETTWAIPNYAYSSSNRYFCGVIQGTSSTTGANRWYALYNSGTSSNKRKSSYRGSSLANIIESDYPDYAHNKKARFRRTNTYFSCYQEIDGVDTQIFLVNASGSNVKAELPCYIGAVNLNGTPTAGYSTAYNLWFYEFEHFDDDDGTYVDIVPVKNTATNEIALKDKITGKILYPQKINTTLDYGGILYDTPRVGAMMLMMGRGFEEPEEFDENENNEEEEQ